MKRLLLTIVSAGLGLYLASLLVAGVSVMALSDSAFFGFSLTQTWQIFILLGIILGLLNYFIKPLLELISLPLEIITLGLFSIVINLGLIWVLDVIFREIQIPLWFPLIYTSLIIGVLNFVTKLLTREA